MSKLVIKNYNNSPLVIVIEPWADEIEVQKGQAVELSDYQGDGKGDLVVEFNFSQSISVWFPGNKPSENHIGAQ